jgi:DNA invertase Pin-like site-specific DNA recombinase
MVASRKRRIKALEACPENVFTAYLRVSTKDQAESRAGLDHQEGAIKLYAQLHGLEIREWRVDPGRSAKSLVRPEMKLALDDVRTGHTRGVIVAKLDRLSRSVIDFANLMREAQRDDWNIVSVDLGVDLRTTNGRLIASIMATIAEWERETIAQRTREGLEAKREQGVRLGRPREADDELLRTVIEMWLDCRNYSAAARQLNEAGLAATRGGRLWYPATVREMVLSQDGRTALAALEEAA